MPTEIKPTEEQAMTFKACARCRRRKAVDHFTPSEWRKGGYCRACKRRLDRVRMRSRFDGSVRTAFTSRSPGRERQAR